VNPSLRILVALALVLSAASCRREQPAVSTLAPHREVPVIVISIDTLRSDRLPAYGYTAGKTPAIDAFRRDSVLFAHAFSHAPTTLPAHASLFTGLLPPRHGVRDNIGYTLGPQHESLASFLRSRGYETGGAVSSYVLRRSTGIAEGFAFFEDTFDYQQAATRTSAERDGERTRAALEGWLDGVSGKRLFAFLHLYEPHAPYAPPAEFENRQQPYDGEVSYADAIVGRFLESLKRRGLYDDALIILLSDHGEGLGDHGEDQHGIFVYRESVQVPLIVKLPRSERANSTREDLAGLVDLFPTIAAHAGLATEGLRFDGHDLFAARTPAPRVIYSETYFPRLHYGWSELVSAIDERHHFILAPQRELYHYRADPGELKNVIDARRREAFALQKTLEATPQNFAEPSAIDPDDQRKLASLGYIGSAAVTSGARPDPKTKIGAVRQLRQAYDLVAARQYRPAIELLEPFIRDNPEVIDAWWLLGQSLTGTGRQQDALRLLKEGAQRFPGNISILLQLADILVSMNRYDEARAHAELALKEEPVRAREFIARMEMKRRRYPEAEKVLREALDHAPQRTEALMLLADALRAQNRRREELEALDRASAAIVAGNLQPLRGLNFFRGEALLSEGRVPEAAQAYRRETELFPVNRRAWSSYALVTGGLGGRDEARRILLQGLELNRDREMAALALEAFEVMGDAEGARQVQAMRIRR
jgi:arylsulfatase A-like enzyme/cytochrome c-type biogenesis protein CcmH/NrfG